MQPSKHTFQSQLHHQHCIKGSTKLTDSRHAPQREFYPPQLQRNIEESRLNWQHLLTKMPPLHSIFEFLPKNDLYDHPTPYWWNHSQCMTVTSRWRLVSRSLVGWVLFRNLVSNTSNEVNTSDVPCGEVVRIPVFSFKLRRPWFNSQYGNKAWVNFCGVTSK